MDYVLKPSLLTETVHKGLKKSAGELSCASTVDFLVGQPRAVVYLVELYIKVCDFVTERFGERYFERKEEGERNVGVEGDVLKGPTPAHI